jgi:hypothetical protein
MDYLHPKVSNHSEVFMTDFTTRSEMYQLVWSEPRTAMAKRFGISDVAIAKHCRNANVPMPPPGYWARKVSGRSTVQPALPLRLPGQKNHVLPQEEDRYGYDLRKEDLDSVLELATFSEPIALLVTDAARRIGKVHACKDLSNPHPGIKRLLVSEQRRRQAWEAHKRDTYYKPYFDDPVFQRQLRLMNSLFWGFDQINCKGEVLAMDEWVQGFGHFHYLRGRICIGATWVAFEFLDPATPKAIKRSPPTGTSTLRVVSNSSDDLDWHDQTGCRLERQLTAVTTAMLEHAETCLRQNAMRVYERRVARRLEMVKAIAAKKAEDERTRLAAIEKHHQDNRDRLRRMAAEHEAAQEIRRFVIAVRSHPECTGVNLETFLNWERKVHDVADSIDPIVGPLKPILGSFSDLPEQIQDNGAMK